MGQLRDPGLEVGLDDFGTGYASLTHLRQLPLSFVKSDQSFVQRMEAHGQDDRIVAAVVNLAANLAGDPSPKASKPMPVSGNSDPIKLSAISSPVQRHPNLRPRLSHQSVIPPRTVEVIAQMIPCALFAFLSRPPSAGLR